jgi:acylphosphatase
VQAITAIISGRVQGVWFRGSTQKKAMELGLTGWVKNTTDGSVYLEAQGEKSHLEIFIGWLSKGPNYSRVDQVDIKWIEATTQYISFSIRY